MNEPKKPEERVEPTFDMPEQPAPSEPQPSPADVADAFDAGVQSEYRFESHCQNQ